MDNPKRHCIEKYDIGFCKGNQSREICKPEMYYMEKYDTWLYQRKPSLEMDKPGKNGLIIILQKKGQCQ